MDVASCRHTIELAADDPKWQEAPYEAFKPGRVRDISLSILQAPPQSDSNGRSYVY